MDIGAWQAAVHGVAKEPNMTEHACKQHTVNVKAQGGTVSTDDHN